MGRVTGRDRAIDHASGARRLATAQRLPNRLQPQLTLSPGATAKARRVGQTSLMLPSARSDRSRVLWVAVVFAVVYVVVWHSLIASSSFTAEKTAPIAYGLGFVDFGGVYVSTTAQALLPLGLGYYGEWAAWAVTDFLGAFVQGFGYAVLGLAFVRSWRRSPGRAVGWSAAVAVVLAASYRVGEALYERANCVSTVERSAEGIGTFTECGASLFGGGRMWATVAFFVAVAVVIVHAKRTREAEERAGHM